jgi:hypothetical protein
MSDWPHASPHRLSEQGAYRVTCRTYGKAHFLHAAGMLDMLRDLLPTESGVKPPHSK